MATYGMSAKDRMAMLQNKAADKKPATTAPVKKLVTKTTEKKDDKPESKSDAVKAADASPPSTPPATSAGRKESIKSDGKEKSKTEDSTKDSKKDATSKVDDKKSTTDSKKSTDEAKKSDDTKAGKADDKSKDKEKETDSAKPGSEKDKAAAKDTKDDKLKTDAAKKDQDSKATDNNKKDTKTESKSDSTLKKQDSTESKDSKGKAGTLKKQDSIPETKSDKDSKTKTLTKQDSKTADDKKESTTAKDVKASNSKTDSKTDSKAKDTKADSKPESKTDSKQDKTESEAKPEAKPETKAETKPEPKPEIKAETKPEPKPEIKAETKPESKPEIKAETKPEPKPETKSEAKPEPKAADKKVEIAKSDDNKTAPKSEAKGADTKIVVTKPDGNTVTPAKTAPTSKYDDLDLTAELQDNLEFVSDAESPDINEKKMASLTTTADSKLQAPKLVPTKKDKSEVEKTAEPDPAASKKVEESKPAAVEQKKADIPTEKPQEPQATKPAEPVREEPKPTAKVEEAAKESVKPAPTKVEEPPKVEVKQPESKPEPSKEDLTKKVQNVGVRVAPPEAEKEIQLAAAEISEKEAKKKEAAAAEEKASAAVEAAKPAPEPAKVTATAEPAKELTEKKAAAPESKPATAEKPEPAKTAVPAEQPKVENKTQPTPPAPAPAAAQKPAAEPAKTQAQPRHREPDLTPEEFYHTLFYFSGMGTVIGSALAEGVYVPEKTANTGVRVEYVEEIERQKSEERRKRRSSIDVAQHQVVHLSKDLHNLHDLLDSLPKFSPTGGSGSAASQPYQRPASAQQRHRGTVPPPLNLQQSAVEQHDHLHQQRQHIQQPQQPIHQQQHAPEPAVVKPSWQAQPKPLAPIQQQAAPTAVPPWQQQKKQAPPPVAEKPKVADATSLSRDKDGIDELTEHAVVTAKHMPDDSSAHQATIKTGPRTNATPQGSHSLSAFDAAVSNLKDSLPTAPGEGGHLGGSFAQHPKTTYSPPPNAEHFPTTLPKKPTENGGGLAFEGSLLSSLEPHTNHVGVFQPKTSMPETRELGVFQPGVEQPIKQWQERYGTKKQAGGDNHHHHHHNAGTPTSHGPAAFQSADVIEVKNLKPWQLSHLRTLEARGFQVRAPEAEGGEFSEAMVHSPPMRGSSAASGGAYPHHRSGSSLSPTKHFNRSPSEQPHSSLAHTGGYRASTLPRGSSKTPGYLSAAPPQAYSPPKIGHVRSSHPAPGHSTQNQSLGQQKAPWLRSGGDEDDSSVSPSKLTSKPKGPPAPATAPKPHFDSIGSKQSYPQPDNSWFTEGLPQMRSKPIDPPSTAPKPSFHLKHTGGMEVPKWTPKLPSTSPQMKPVSVVVDTPAPRPVGAQPPWMTSNNNSAQKPLGGQDHSHGQAPPPWLAYGEQQRFDNSTSTATSASNFRQNESRPAVGQHVSRDMNNAPVGRMENGGGLLQIMPNNQMAAPFASGKARPRSFSSHNASSPAVAPVSFGYKASVAFSDL